MKQTVIKSSIIFLLSVFMLSCGNDKKENNEKKDKEVTAAEKFKAKQDKEKEEQVYYKNAIEGVLNSPSEYAYYTSDVGINTFIKGDEIICFLDTKYETDLIYTDNFFANVFKTGGKESLAFEFMDFEKDDIKIGDTNYMLAAFNFKDVESTTSIQVGQYSKEKKEITWKVLIPKGRFHK